MAYPTITMNQISDAIEGPSTEPNVKAVLEGLVNDYMDLQFGKTTPYTTGKQILPTGVTAENVTEGLKDSKAPVFVRNVLMKILETYEKEEYVPQPNDGSWDAKFNPVLQLIKD